MAQSRQIQAQKTKQKILDTSLKLFAEYGFNQITVDQIVKETGTSKGAFYNHFKSKYEIFLEKFKEIDEFYMEVDNNQPKHTTATEKIIILTDNHLKYIRDFLGKDVVRILLINTLNQNKNTTIPTEKRAHLNIIKKYIEIGQASGEFRTDMTSNNIANILVRSSWGSMYDWFSKDDYDLVEEGNTFISLLLYSLKKTEELDEQIIQQ